MEAMSGPGMKAFLNWAMAVAIGVFGVLASSVAVAADSERFLNDWQVQDLSKHPLVGRVWSREAGGFVPPDALKAALTKAPIVLLGEIHDNADHHRIQARALSIILESGRRPDVVFEQFRSDVQPALDTAQAKGLVSVAALKAVTQWDASGWKTYNYDPLFDAVLAAKLKIHAGDVLREQMVRVVKGGAEALPQAERDQLQISRDLGRALDAAALEDVFASHCGVMAKEALSGMASAQRYRDAHLADAVLKAAEGGAGVVLIAGNGHVRSDRGVPWYLRARAQEMSVLTVMPIEVEEGKDDPGAYVVRDPDGKPAADFVIFTPRYARGDPCAELKARMKR